MNVDIILYSFETRLYYIKSLLEKYAMPPQFLNVQIKKFISLIPAAKHKTHNIITQK